MHARARQRVIAATANKIHKIHIPVSLAIFNATTISRIVYANLTRSSLGRPFPWALAGATGVFFSVNEDQLIRGQAGERLGYIVKTELLDEKSRSL